MRLTKHFLLYEMVESDTALRLGIDNTPPPAVIENLRKTANIAEMIREELSQNAGRDVPLFILSGHRCEALEKIICAKDFANWCKRRNADALDPVAWSTYFLRKSHPQGRSIDFRAPTFGTPYQIVKFIVTTEVMGHVDQIIMEGTWVHVSWSEAPRHEVLTASFDSHGVATYAKWLAA